MLYLDREQVNIAKIADSGQCFRMKLSGGVWLLPASDKTAEARESSEALCIDCSRSEEDFWRHYFDADTDYQAFIDAVDPQDPFLTKAAEYGKGIRILNQDPFEMLITFIISQRKNIPAISSCVEKLSALCGNKLADGVYAFPTAEALASAPLGDCGLGYRSDYVKRAAAAVAEGRIELQSLNRLSDEELFKTLTSFYGVGPKVANCIMLFAYHRIAAFPIDVWIARIMEEKYGGSFPLKRYEGFAGVMQQYMFYYGRKTALR